MQKRILLYTLIACILLWLIENITHPIYSIQAGQKILLFFLIPFLFSLWKQKHMSIAGKCTKKSFLYGIFFGFLSAGIISLTYLFLRDQIDWFAIHESMTLRGITRTTFIGVFLYIMLVNALLEEYFFRGIVFQNLQKYSRIYAYFVSSIAFSLYHITIFGTWFSGWLLLLALFGLFCGGIFFAWLYRKTEGIWGAYIVHIFADLAILVIGWREFF